MFIFRWIKRIVVLVFMVIGISYVANYSWHGKPIKQHLVEAYNSGELAEAYKDIKTWIVEIFKFGRNAGEEISKADRTKLESIITNELKDNVRKLKEDAVKTEEKANGGDKKVQH